MLNHCNKVQKGFPTHNISLNRNCKYNSDRSYTGKTLSYTCGIKPVPVFTFILLFETLSAWQTWEGIPNFRVLALVDKAQWVPTFPPHHFDCTCWSIVLLVPSLCCSMLFFTYILSTGVKSSFMRASSSFNCSFSFPEPACKLQKDLIPCITMI